MNEPINPTSEAVKRAPSNDLGALILERSVAGYYKYGEPMGRADLDAPQWVDHAVEEALDLAQYLIRVREALTLLTEANQLISTIENPSIPVETWLEKYAEQFGKI